MPSTVIDARRITRRHAARTVLDAVDLNVGGHSRIAIVGPNGSGKSTLLVSSRDGTRGRRRYDYGEHRGLRASSCAVTRWRAGVRTKRASASARTAG